MFQPPPLRHFPVTTFEKSIDESLQAPWEGGLRSERRRGQQVNDVDWWWKKGAWNVMVEKEEEGEVRNFGPHTTAPLQYPRAHSSHSTTPLYLHHYPLVSGLLRRAASEFRPRTNCDNHQQQQHYQPEFHARHSRLPSSVARGELSVTPGTTASTMGETLYDVEPHVTLDGSVLCDELYEEEQDDKEGESGESLSMWRDSTLVAPCSPTSRPTSTVISMCTGLSASTCHVRAFSRVLGQAQPPAPFTTPLPHMTLTARFHAVAPDEAVLVSGIAQILCRRANGSLLHRWSWRFRWRWPRKSSHLALYNTHLALYSRNPSSRRGSPISTLPITSRTRVSLQHHVGTPPQVLCISTPTSKPSLVCSVLPSRLGSLLTRHCKQKEEREDVWYVHVGREDELLKWMQALYGLVHAKAALERES